MSTTDELIEEATLATPAEKPVKPARSRKSTKTERAEPAETRPAEENALLAEWDRGDIGEGLNQSAPEQERTEDVKSRATRAATPRIVGGSRRVRKDQPATEPAATNDDRPAGGSTAPSTLETVRAGAADGPSIAEPAADEPTTTFEDLGLSGALLKSINAVGYEEPTPIQLITIPVLLEGRDVIAQAQTGSGKTAAFGFPIIEAIDPQSRQVQALILCPTRELAIQVAEALHKYGRHKEVETLPIYGGQPYERQFRGLARGVQIVVGTPGRVMDHMRRGTLNLDGIRFFVLDEGDEMLDMGFIEDIEWILEQAPANRQTALFSATMPPRIVDLASRYLNDPERLTVAGKQMTVPETRQTSYEVPKARKVDALTRILDAETPPLTMIFCRTKLGVDELGEALLARGYQVETLHGDLSQAQRDRVMRRFRAGQADILIATDVAARGLDIPDVTHVINYDIPESAEAYVHRVGRTGRAGRHGEAITLVTPRETRWLRQIERIVKARIEPKRLPTASDVAERRREVLKGQVTEVLKSEDGYSQYLEVIGDLAEEHDVSEIAAAIMKLYADETGRGTPTDLKEDDIATLTAATTSRGESGMTRLFLNIGRNFGVRPQDIVGAIANEADIPGRSIGAIDILDSYTFVDIPAEFTDRVIEAVRRSGIKGRPVNAEVAQPGQGRPSRESPRRDGFDRDRGGFRDRGPRDGFQGGRDHAFGAPRFERDRDQARDGGFRRDFERGDAPPRQFERNEPQRRDFERSGPPRFERERDGNVRPEPPRFDRDRSGPAPFGNRRDDGPRRFDRDRPDRGRDREPGGRRDY